MLTYSFRLGCLLYTKGAFESLANSPILPGSRCPTDPDPHPLESRNGPDIGQISGRWISGPCELRYLLSAKT